MLNQITENNKEHGMITNKEKRQAYGELFTSPALTKTILTVLTISGIVSISSTMMMVEKFNISSEKTLYIAISGIILLILLDYVKRLFFSNYVNSEIEEPITEIKKSKLSLVMLFLTVTAVLMIDLMGSYSTAIMVEQQMQKSSITDSLDYEIMQKNKDNEAINMSTEAYQKAHNEWKKAKAENKADCKQDWKGKKWRTKRGICINSFKEKEPKKEDFKQSATINKDDITKIKNKNSNLFIKYVFYFVFGIIGLILGVMNYLTLSEMVQNRRDILVLLTDTRVSIIKGFISKLQQMKDEETREILEKVEEHHEEVGKQKIEAKELELALSRSTEEALLNQLKTNVKDTTVTAQNYTIKKRNTKKNNKSSTVTNQDKFDADKLRNRILNEYDSNKKIISKSELIDLENRAEDKVYKSVTKELVREGLITLKKGYGYYLA